MEWNILKFCLSFVSVLLLQIQLPLENGWDPINQFHPITFCIPVPSQNVDFQRHMEWSFLCSELRRDAIVRFPDIGGIIDQYCLNCFLFLRNVWYVRYVRRYMLQIVYFCILFI